jgi:ABC-2 type transport system permease protein
MWLIVLNNLKVTFRKKKNIVVYIVVPILVTLASLAMYSGNSSDSIKVGIVNNDGGTIASDYISSLQKNERFKVSTINEEQVRNSISTRKLDCVIELPKNFQMSIKDGSLKEIKLFSIKGEAATAWIKVYTNYYVKNLTDIAMASQGNTANFNKMYEGFKAQHTTLSIEKLQDVSTNKNATVQSMGFLLMFIMVQAIGTSSIIVKERQMRTYNRICTAPVNSRMYVLANIVTNILIILIQVSIVVMVATKVIHMNTFIPDIYLIGILLCFGIASVGLGILIVALSKTSYQVSTATTLISTPTCMLGGCFWPMSIMPDMMQKAANFLPQKWTMDAITKLQGGSSIGEIGINIVIILAFAVAFFIMAAYKFNNSDKANNFI